MHQWSFSLDESTDISDAAKLVIFFRAVTVGFDDVEEFLDMASLASTIIGHDICEYEIRVVENFKLNPAKLCGLAIDGVPSMTGRTNGFTQKFSGCRWSTRCSCNSLHNSPRELVY